MRPEKYILLGYQICKLSGIDMNISFCTFVWNIRLLELKSAKQWNLKFMRYFPTPQLLSQIFLKYYRNTVKSVFHENIQFILNIFCQKCTSKLQMSWDLLFFWLTSVLGLENSSRCAKTTEKTPFSSVSIAQYSPS